MFAGKSFMFTLTLTLTTVSRKMFAEKSFMFTLTVFPRKFIS
jgi:hypothetical protein